MIINKILIKKFRGFHDVQFQLGKYLTIIAGQNGTQKTTLLGILSQPFSISDSKNPLHGEKPLCGGNYKSAFAEKFKLSETFDKPKTHEWTLNLNREKNPDFTIESIKRASPNNSIRFWKKGDRSKGAGYIQLPVIYLSLSRLLPIGEDEDLNSSNDVVLTDSEFEFYQKWHNKILIIPDVKMTKFDYLKSKQKNTLAANTDFYDWKMNSAGQDNIGKILLAILSFKRLKETHKDEYNGGILAIDELDATLYPASQIKLIEALRKFASNYNVQTIATTHSLTILEETCKLQVDSHCAEQTKVVYLEKSDRNINIIEKLPFETIMHKLNITLGISRKIKKIPTFTEDAEGKIFLKALLKSKSFNLNCLDCSLGCDNLLELSKKKIPGFKYPDSLIVLDGDIRNNSSKLRKANKLQNILLLPGKDSPERLIAKFLHELSDASPIWNKIYLKYTKQLCFKDISIEEIQSDRNKAKNWFKSQMQYWGRGCVKIINSWMQANNNDVNEFIRSFDYLFEKYVNVLSLDVDN